MAQENIELNPGMENIHVAPGDLLRGVEIKADVVVANILADILIHLTEDAYRLLKDEGYPSAFFSSGASVTKASVVNIMAATPAALAKAEISTLAGSITPSLTKSLNSPVKALKP